MMVEENLSPMHLFKCVSAVGDLYDFYMQCYRERLVAPNELPGLMRDFFMALAYGNSALGWKPVGRKSAKKKVRYVSEFSKYCSENFGTIQVNPIEKKFLGELNIRDQLQYYKKMEHKKTWDFLDHLTPTTEQGQGIITNFSFNPKMGRISQNRNKNYFPPEKVLKLISATPNIRDKLAFILLFFGGLRESELLHLYVTDITTPNGEAEINISHPELSLYRWQDQFRGNQTGARQYFLNERYGLTPRNKLGINNPNHAGWKGMMYAKKDDYEAEFYWLLPEMSRYFAKLHRIYLHQYRAGIADNHPYYFINLQGDSFGTPLKLSNFNKSFYRAAERIGLSSKDAGVAPHGARHFYGYFLASYLKIPIDRAQRMLRHASINSTRVYYSLDEKIIRDELRKAYEKIAEEIPAFIQQLNDMTLREL